MNNATIKALAKDAMANPRARKQVQLQKEEVVLADGSVFKPMPVKTSSDLLRASLLMMFKHVADIHVVVIQVIAEKFGLDIEDLQKAITEDPRWSEMLANPIITDLTAAAKENSTPPPKKRGRPAKKVAPPKAPTPPPAPPKKPMIIIADDEDLVF